MTWLQMDLFLANFPAELLIWVVVGVVWAAVQIFAKMNKERKPSDSQGEPKPPRRNDRPASSMDPVSPTDELRDFLRKLSGENEGETQRDGTTPPPRQEASRPPPVPVAARRPASSSQSSADRRPGEFKRSPPPVRPVPQQDPAMQTMQNRQRPGVLPSRLTPPASIKNGMPRRHLKSPTLRMERMPGKSKKAVAFGNWRAAIIHREIIGPPRALRPYSPNEL